MAKNFESSSWSEGEESPEDRYKKLLEEEELFEKKGIKEENEGLKTKEIVGDILKPKDPERQAIITLLGVKESLKELLIQLSMLENSEKRKKKQGFVKRITGHGGEAKKRASIEKRMHETLWQLSPALDDLGLQVPKTPEEAKELYDKICSFENWQKISQITQENRPTHFDGLNGLPEEDEE